MFTNTFLYAILGIEIQEVETDYPFINYYWAYIATCIRSSVGDIQPPGYSFWIAAAAKNEHVAVFMIYFIWLIWFCTLFINLVILLNFLIAIISQSYEDVMSREVITKYGLRSTMNEQCRLIMKALSFSDNVTMFVLSANNQHEMDGNNWLGFVNTLKKHMNQQTILLNNKLKSET